MKQKPLTALFVLLFFLYGASAELAGPVPENGPYVGDGAEVLFPDTKDHIEEHSAALFPKTGVRIAVATAESPGETGSASPGTGQPEEDKLIFIFLTTGDGKITVEIGPGLERVVSGSKARRFVDSYAADYLSGGDFDAGVKILYDALLAEVYRAYKLEIPLDVEIPQSSGPDAGLFAAVAAVLLLIAISFLTRKGRGKQLFGGFFGPPDGGIDGRGR